MIQLWQRYILKEILKVFVFFLVTFFFLYALMDYSTHMQDFIKDKKILFGDFFLYYAAHFVKRSELLLPLALLIATIKVLRSISAHHELLALQLAGIKLKTILRPFFLIASLCTLFSFSSVQFFLPSSLEFLDRFHEKHFSHAYKGAGKERINVIYLKDHSQLLYQSYNASSESFFDVLWIRSINDIWRIKFLKKDKKGQYVDHLQRNKEGFLEKTESFNTYAFEELKWQENAGFKGYIPIENRSFSHLYRLYFQKSSTTAYQKPEILSQLLFKFLLPFLSFLVVIALVPFCVRYSRSFSSFFIYALGIFGYLTFYILIDSALILGTNQTISPFSAILAPFALCSSIFLYRFLKL